MPHPFAEHVERGRGVLCAFRKRSCYDGDGCAKCLDGSRPYPGDALTNAARTSAATSRARTATTADRSRGQSAVQLVGALTVRRTPATTAGGTRTAS